MFLDWTKHLRDDEEKKRFEQAVVSAKPVLERLTTLIKEKEALINRNETDIANFDTPNWSEKQAFRNGLKSAFQSIRTLIDLDQQKILRIN